MTVRVAAMKVAQNVAERSLVAVAAELEVQRSLLSEAALLASAKSLPSN